MTPTVGLPDHLALARLEVGEVVGPDEVERGVHQRVAQKKDARLGLLEQREQHLAADEVLAEHEDVVELGAALLVW